MSIETSKRPFNKASENAAANFRPGRSLLLGSFALMTLSAENELISSILDDHDQKFLLKEARRKGKYIGSHGEDLKNFSWQTQNQMIGECVDVIEKIVNVLKNYRYNAEDTLEPAELTVINNHISYLSYLHIHLSSVMRYTEFFAGSTDPEFHDADYIQMEGKNIRQTCEDDLSQIFEPDQLLALTYSFGHFIDTIYDRNTIRTHCGKRVSLDSALKEFFNISNRIYDSYKDGDMRPHAQRQAVKALDKNAEALSKANQALYEMGYDKMNPDFVLNIQSLYKIIRSYLQDARLSIVPDSTPKDQVVIPFAPRAKEARSRRSESGIKFTLEN